MILFKETKDDKMAEKMVNRELPKISKENKKFVFTEETKTVVGSDGKEHILHRIRAMRDMILGGGSIVVHKGDLGGFIEKEENLDFSEKSNAWVFEGAMVYESAHVTDDAGVSNKAQVYGSACVCGNARVFDRARVFDQARVSFFAVVYDSAHIHGTAEVCGYTYVHGKAELTDGKWTYGDITEYNCVKEARRP